MTNEREIKKGQDLTKSGRCRVVMLDCDGKEDRNRSGRGGKSLG
jgi:hypothetical protein